MSTSPSTPAKPAYCLPIGPLSISSNKISMYNSTTGPSPASTSGETSFTNSQPVTPLGTSDIGFLRGSHHGVQLPAIDEADAVTFGSPTMTKIQYRGGDRSDHASRSASAGNRPLLGLEKLESIKAVLTSNPPLSGPPEKRFVLQSRDSEADDPFAITTTPTRRTRSANVTPSKRGLVTLSAHTTPSSGNRGSVKVTKETPSKHTPRPDRMIEELSADNAQGLLPPDACVFVANLSTACSDERLEKAVSEVFHEFGECYTKIRRDSRGMPFAFVQYKTHVLAIVAIKRGRGRMIEGRKCRTELARAQRALYVSRIDGDSVDIADVKDILRPYGDIEHEFRPNDTDVVMYGLPSGGVFFRFAFYQDCGDAVGNLRNHPDYRFENRMEPHGEGPSRRSARRSVAGLSPDSPATRRSSNLHNRPASKTVHVGNLPMDINYHSLYQVFHQYGDIVSCQIVIKQPYYKQNDEDVTQRISSVYALIEYDFPPHAATAAKAQDGKTTPVTSKHKLQVRYPPPATTAASEAFGTQGGVVLREQSQAWTMPPSMHAQSEAFNVFTPGMTPFTSAIPYYDVAACNTSASTMSAQSGNLAQYASPYHSIPASGLYGVAPSLNNHTRHVMQHDFAIRTG